ncbi:MFS transporter [Streptomyces sp. 7R015]|uniref:MFS transporter n=1 Tax=Streptomyces cylindrosporus TaxID=2927583 RepID=A0ABS9YJ72_9ACTN|nr:MFS transporter [Streptomyces cylindrosporus]MCI3277230.1 MFS transporter [Streptomyces cylindrosporus]
MVGVESAGVRESAWRGGFGRLWTAAVVSRFGDALRGAALPLLAASLTDRPLLIASVTACGYLPWIVFGLLGGAVADRVDQRRAMWTVDAVRGLLVAAFAVTVALGHASIALLIALAFALTTLQTLFDNAATALLPALVDRSELGSANARLMTGQQIAGGLLGAPVVPLLIAVGASIPFATDAATFLVAAALVASLRPTPTPGSAPGSTADTHGLGPAEGTRGLGPVGGTRGSGSARGTRSPGLAGGTRGLGSTDGTCGPGQVGGARSPGLAGGTRGLGPADGTRSQGSADGARGPGLTGSTRSPGLAGGTRGSGSADGARSPGSADGARSPGRTGGIPGQGSTGGRRSPRSAGSTLRREIADGMRALWRDRDLRGLCAATALCNVGMGALIATLVILVTGWLDAGTAGYAAATTAYTVGGLAGGAGNRRIVARLGPARSVLLAGSVQIGALVVMGSVRSLAATVAALAVFGFMGMVWNVNTTTLMQQRTPAELLGRVSSAFRTLAVAGAPLGALLGGAVATAWGLNTPALLTAAFFVLSVLALIPGRKPDVPVVAPDDDATTAHAPR